MILEARKELVEGSDAWNVAAIAVPRAAFTTPVLLTQSDITGSIVLNIYPQDSSTPVYTTSFAKTLVQDGSTMAIHTALVDARWEGEDAIGHNFVHLIRQVDVGAGVLRGGRKFTMVYEITTLLDGVIFPTFTWDIRPRH